MHSTCDVTRRRPVQSRTHPDQTTGTSNISLENRRVSVRVIFNRFFVLGYTGDAAEGEESGSGGKGGAGREMTSLDGDVLLSGGAPFETHLWRARLAIQRATNAMLAAYEVRSSSHGPVAFTFRLVPACVPPCTRCVAFRICAAAVTVYFFVWMYVSCACTVRVAVKMVCCLSDEERLCLMCDLGVIGYWRGLLSIA